MLHGDKDQFTVTLLPIYRTRAEFNVRVTPFHFSDWWGACHESADVKLFQHHLNSRSATAVAVLFCRDSPM